jgi:hypothetical protein
MPAYGRKKACNSAGLQPRRLYFCKAAGQSCRAMVQYAESMVKLVENAVF